MIERARGRYKGRNKASAFKDLVWTVATAADTTLEISGQTEMALGVIEANLNELASSKERIVSAQVYLADMADKPAMDAVWNKWIGDNPDYWPQRACVGVDLAGDTLVEITVVAVRNESG